MPIDLKPNTLGAHPIGANYNNYFCRREFVFENRTHSSCFVGRLEMILGKEKS